LMSLSKGVWPWLNTLCDNNRAGRPRTSSAITAVAINRLSRLPG
jgi:hypothetical protein